MSKKIVVASDSFKGSATSKEIGTYVAEAIQEIRPDCQVDVFAIADGGEGTVEAVAEVLKGEYVTVEVEGPLGEMTCAKYVLANDGKIAVMEMAEASGITLVPSEKLDVMKASTIGTGQMIADAIHKGVEHIYIGIGGSATNDGGMGMAHALGFRFLDRNGEILSPSGENLIKIAKIDDSSKLERLENVTVTILSDVNNPLCGELGASAVYGPQKGATPEMVTLLDEGLQHYGQLISDCYGLDVIQRAGAGAAGGLGAGLMAFLNATSKSGIDTVLELIGIESAISQADLVITGEGRLDGQSVNGKAPVGIASIAKKYDVPVVAIVGSRSVNVDNVYPLGIAGVFDIINQPMTLAQAVENTQALVKSTTKNVITLFSRLTK